MPRFVQRFSSGTLFNNLAVLALSPDPVANFCLLSFEVTFGQTSIAQTPVRDQQGVIEIQRATSAGSGPNSLVPAPCDPKSNGVNLVTPRFNYVSTPGLGTAEYRISCPYGEYQYLSWEEGEYVIPGGSFPLTFVHASGASMPASTSYRITVEWLE